MWIDDVDVGAADSLGGAWLVGKHAASDVVSALYDLLPSHSFIDDSASIHESSIIQSSIIGPNVTIYEHVVVRNCVVMEGCQIGHASEIARSCIFPDASVPRFNYVGASIMGEASRLGGCVSMASRRFDDAEVTLQDGTTTGLQKLGAIVGARSLIGFGVHLNPGVKIGADTIVQSFADVRRDVPPSSYYLIEVRGRAVRRRWFSGRPFPRLSR